MNEFPKRIYSLDILRGLAAISVVFWHWQHFFYDGGKLGTFVRENQPFYETFSILYQRGNLAVELFFSISGFVFFWLFSEKVANGEMKAKRFIMDRFSRLYPLHIATFLLVILLQAIYTRSHETFFVYQINDAFHAVLNILLIPAWGLEKGWSFNAPIWSVSIEVMLYAAFFVICLTGRIRYALTLAAIIAGYFIYQSNYKIGTGVFTFFCGGTAYLICSILLNRIGHALTTAIAAAIAIAAWGALMRLPDLSMFLLTGIAYPSSLAVLALLDRHFQPIASKLSFVGDISYSSYLIHFSLQIVFAMVVDRLGGSRDVFYNPWVMVAFLVILIPICLASHKLFEMPMQKAIRNYCLSDRNGRASRA